MSDDTKPNGLTCLSCGRPLYGRQKKWCKNDDCKGWYDLYPEGKIICECCGCEFTGNIGYHLKCGYCKDHTEPCGVDITCSICKQSMRVSKYHNEKALKWICIGCKESLENVKPPDGFVYHYLADGSVCVKPSLQHEYPRLAEIEKKLSRSDVSCEERESLIDEARSLGFKISVDIDKDVIIIKTALGDFRIGPIITSMISELYNPKYCEKCKKITEHSVYGYCLTCSNPAVEAINRRISQYKEWTGDQEWRYDAGTYWLLAWEKMYEFVLAGRALSEISNEFDVAEGTVRSRVYEYCKKKGFDSPWKQKKRIQRQPSLSELEE